MTRFTSQPHAQIAQTTQSGIRRLSRRLQGSAHRPSQAANIVEAAIGCRPPSLKGFRVRESVAEEAVGTLHHRPGPQHDAEEHMEVGFGLD